MHNLGKRSMSLVLQQACLGCVQIVLQRSRYGPAEAFLGVLSLETWLAVLLSASDRGREDLSSANELIEQIPELRETDLWGPGGRHNESLVRVYMGV